MTKQQKKMKSMLNYYEIDMGGRNRKRDEKMSPMQLQRFLDKFNYNYDYHTIRDIVKKLKDNWNKGKKEQQDQDEFMGDHIDDIPEFPPMDREDPGYFDKYSDTSKSTPDNGEFGLPQFSMSEQFFSVEEFIKWISGILNVGEHQIVVMNQGDMITIQLIKVNNNTGGKK